MKFRFIAPLLCIIFFSCSKSKNTNVLVGKYMQERVIEQYTDPFTASTQSDTLLQSFPVEFKNDGNFFTNGEQLGTYSILGDSSFSLKPVGNIAIVNIYGTYNIIAIGNGILKTRRAGGNGEQIKIFNPDMQGMFAYAHIQYVFTEYQKQ